jgi:alpha-tubulin suppressor-like RCC1 family protein
MYLMLADDPCFDIVILIVIPTVDEDEGVSIRKIVCGPTDTAMVLSDGRCFLSGMNKQGQLG